MRKKKTEWELELLLAILKYWKGEKEEGENLLNQISKEKKEYQWGKVLLVS